MRRAWWLGVLLVSCDFDAAYERRCDAGLCSDGGQGGGATAGGQGGGSTAGGQSGGSIAGGQGGGSIAGGQGGGSIAGGQGGGSIAGGQGGGSAAGGGAGSLCPTTPTLEVTVFDGGVEPISATACVKLDIALRCQGVRLDAGVPIRQLRVFNKSTAQPRAGTLFSDSTCATSPLTFTTGDVYFNSTVDGGSYMFGTYEVSIEAADAGLSRLVRLEPGIAGSPAMVLLPVNTCLTLPRISFVGLDDMIAVQAPARQRFEPEGGLAAPLLSCGQQAVLVNTGESTSTGMPQVTSTEPSTAGAGLVLYGDAGQVFYLVRPCVIDGGTVSNTSLCCASAGAMNSDGGVACP